ncbi:MAG: alanine--tRNA ligase, partial [Chloroflexi bacterium]|nr:alanine--tRNA ligase [Chloroflexota bacterium]
GVLPGTVGRGYVLRMIIRRAARFGRKIGFTEPFLAEIAQAYIDQMGEIYPELRKQREHVLHTLTGEERKFARALDNALAQLDEALGRLHQDGRREIPGDVAFNLYASHGLPLEITRDVAGERGFTVDEAGYNAARQAHAEASRGGGLGEYELGDSVYARLLAQLVESGRLDSSGVDYDPYSGARLESEIVGIIRDSHMAQQAAAGDRVEVVTAATPFYMAAGGEVSDTGRIVVEDGEVRVEDTRRPAPGVIVHAGQVVRGEVAVGQVAQLEVDDERRWNIRRNHTATHILHRELRARLGKHVTQQGSLVAPDRLRFDFSHTEAVDEAMLGEIEETINETILANRPVNIEYMPQKEAVSAGAMALFGEKYGDIVRTIKIGDPDKPYSFELCGGLHVSETGDIGLFYFTGEEAVAAGIRRVEAVTGRGALAYVNERLAALERVAQRLNAPVAEVETRLEALLAENRALQKEVAQLRRNQAKSQMDGLLASMQQVNGVSLVAARVEVADMDGLREMADWFRDRVPSGVAVLAAVKDEKPMLVVAVTEDLVQRGVRADALVRDVAGIVGGGGGGRPTLAQAGGRDASKLPQALAAVPGLVEKALS